MGLSAKFGYLNSLYHGQRVRSLTEDFKSFVMESIPISETFDGFNLLGHLKTPWLKIQYGYYIKLGTKYNHKQVTKTKPLPAWLTHTNRGI